MNSQMTTPWRGSSASFPGLAGASFRRRLGQYLTYASSAALAIMVYYIFAVVFSSPEVISRIDQNLRLEGLFQGSAVTVGVFSAVFLWYGTIIFTAQRRREFALFQLHGLGSRALFFLIIAEQLMVGLLASGIGLAGGVLFSRFFLAIFQSLTGITGIIEIHHSLAGLFRVTLVFLLLFVVAGLFAFLTARLTPIRILFRSGQTMQGRPRPPVVITILGLIFTAAGYILSTQVTMDTIMSLFLPVVSITILGTFLIFQGIHVALAAWYRRRGERLGRPGLIAAGGNLMFRRRNYGVILGMVAVMNAIAITGIGVLLVFYSDATSVQEQMNSLSKAQISFLLQEDSNATGPATLPAAAANPRLHTQILEFASPGQDLGTAGDPWLVSRSQVQALLAPQGIQFPQLSPGNILVLIRPNQTSDSDGSTAGQGSDRDTSPTTGFIESLGLPESQALEPAGVLELQLLPPWLFGASVGVVADADFQALLQSGVLRTRRQAAAITADLDQSAAASAPARLFSKQTLEDLRSIDAEMVHSYPPEWIDKSYYSMSMAMDEFYRYMGLYFFIIIFMALVVFAGNAGLVFFRNITDAYAARHRFRLMGKLGFSTTQLHRVIRAEVVPSFFLPLLVGGVHTAFALRVLEQVLGLSVWGAFLWLSLGYLFLYGICSLAAARVYRNIALGWKNGAQ